jgi:hypothetical protein
MSASPIRDSAGKLAITPGDWWYDKGQLENEGFVIRDCGEAGIIVCSFVDPDHEWIEESEANAALIAEAGTVTNQTGRTPAELAALVRELRDWIKATIHLSGYSRELVAMQKTIAKSEGV